MENTTAGYWLGLNLPSHALALVLIHMAEKSPRPATLGVPPGKPLPFTELYYLFFF